MCPSPRLEPDDVAGAVDDGAPVHFPGLVVAPAPLEAAVLGEAPQLGPGPAVASRGAGMPARHFHQSAIPSRERLALLDREDEATVFASPRAYRDYGEAFRTSPH